MDLILSVVLIVQILFPTFREVSCICDWPLENRKCLLTKKRETESICIMNLDHPFLKDNYTGF